MSQYQETGISFDSAIEAGKFLTSQGFAVASEGYSKTCELTGDTIEASYVLTQGRCFVTMKPRRRIERAGRYLGEYRGLGVYELGGQLAAWTNDEHRVALALSYDTLKARIDLIVNG